MIKRSEVNDGDIVWAYAYSTNSTEKSMALKKEPVKGVIKNDKNTYYFYEFKKNGELKKSSRVYLSSRSYALTEEDAIKEYNEDVMRQVRFLDDLKERCMKDLV